MPRLKSLERQAGSHLGAAAALLPTLPFLYPSTTRRLASSSPASLINEDRAQDVGDLFVGALVAASRGSQTCQHLSAPSSLRHAMCRQRRTTTSLTHFNRSNRRGFSCSSSISKPAHAVATVQSSHGPWMGEMSWKTDTHKADSNKTAQRATYVSLDLNSRLWMLLTRI